MSNKNRSRKGVRQASPLEQTLRFVAVIAIVAIFVLSGLSLTQNANNAQVATTPTAGVGSPTALIFPTVPSGGTSLQFDRTYIHPTGLFSISHLLGWDLPPSGEEASDPTSTIQVARAGATFINSASYSVVHVYVEHDLTNKVKTVTDLDKSYDKTYFDAAWANFTGGYKEISRTTQNDTSVVSFTLSLSGSTYLGRQISQLSNGWVKAIRLVTPDNNPGLMDNLQKTEWASFQIYPAEENTPLAWPSIVDPVMGYVIRYVPGWKLETGTPGTPFVASGPLSGSSIKLTTMAEQGKQVNSETDAQTWVKAQNASATVQTVKAATINGVAGFNVSYQSPDADGNIHSALSTLLTGSGKLFSATFVSSVAKVDMLGTTGVPPDLAQMRNTLLLIPSDQLIPTLTPTITLTPTVTPTGADTLTAAANATQTALATTAVPTNTNTSTATNTLTSTATVVTATPSPTSTKTVTSSPTATNTNTETASPSPSPTSSPTASPTNTSTTTTEVPLFTGTAAVTSAATTSPAATQ